MKRMRLIPSATLVVLGLAGVAAAQSFELNWYTVDGGGESGTAGDAFDLSGTIGQPDAGALTGGAFELRGGFWAGIAAAAPNVTITSANPPTALANPYAPGQPYRDVLDTGTSSALTAGIGGTGTQPQGAIQFAQVSVSFNAAPSPAPTPGNVSVSCTGGSAGCPTVTAVSGSGSAYALTLSGVIPPLRCTTLTFAGTSTGQKLQYQSLPGDVDLDGSSSTLDLLALTQRINDGSGNQPVNLARYNIDRSTGGGNQVNTLDLLRLVQLLNGVNTTQAFSGATVAACP
jgi:hypothetical protein